MENECRSTRKNRQRFGILSSVIAVIKPPRSRRRRRLEHAGRGVNTWQCSDRGVRNNGLLEALRRVLTAGELVARSVVRGGRRSWRLVGVGGRCRMRRRGVNAVGLVSRYSPSSGKFSQACCAILETSYRCGSTSSFQVSRASRESSRRAEPTSLFGCRCEIRMKCSMGVVEAS